MRKHTKKRPASSPLLLYHPSISLYLSSSLPPSSLHAGQPLPNLKGTSNHVYCCKGKKEHSTAAVESHGWKSRLGKKRLESNRLQCRRV